MRMLPASLSARLLLALCGSILAAQLAGTVVFLYDRQMSTARWSAIFWSVRVIDLVRTLDTMDVPQRKLTLEAIADKTDVKELPTVRRASLNLNTDAEFIRFFRQRVAQLRQHDNAITIGPAQSGFRPDIELNSLPELPAAGKATFYDVRIPFSDGTSLKLRLRVVERVIPTVIAYHFYFYPLALLVALMVGTWVMS